jgi:hypothetical protein
MLIQKRVLPKRRSAGLPANGENIPARKAQPGHRFSSCEEAVAGVELIDENSGGPGVRLRKRTPIREDSQGEEAVADVEFIDRMAGIGGLVGRAIRTHPT